jgi:hypothetical protein
MVYPLNQQRLSDPVRPSCPVRWVETFTGALGIWAPQRGAGVGMSSRVPATLSLSARLTIDGERVASLNVGGVHRADLEQLLAEGDRIKSDEIASWFHSGWLTPNDSDLMALESALNAMRVTLRAVDTAIMARTEVKANINELLRNLPSLIELQQQDFELAPKTPGAVQHGTTVLHIFNDLLAAAQRADKFLGRTARPGRVAAWFSDALWIATYLRMLGERAGIPVGLTKADSPGVRFIYQAIKRALPKEGVRPASVARNMDRHKEMIDPWRPQTGV